MSRLFYNIVENDEPNKSFKSESHSPYKDELNKISLWVLPIALDSIFMDWTHSFGVIFSISSSTPK